MTLDVTVDTSRVQRGMGQLAHGLERVPKPAGYAQARDTADKIRGYTPVRSGRLAGTVTASQTADGGAVHYGGSLPYAHYIEGRAHPVERGLVDCAPAFHSKMTDATAREVNGL